MESSIEERYAMALLSIAKDENKVEEYQQEGKRIYTSLKDNPEMIHLLSSYFLEQGEKDKVIDQVLSSCKLPNMLNFVKLICLKGRAFDILAIFRSFNKLCNETRRVYEGICYVAKPIDKKDLSRVEEAVSKALGGIVELTQEEDPSLIGGVKVVVGGKVFDGSIKSSLLDLRQSLVKGGK